MNREQGFIYLEALAAASLLAFILLSTVPMFVIASRQSAASGDMTVVASLAQDMAERLKSTEISTLASGNDSVRIGGITYRRTWTVTANSPHPGLTTVAVAVTPSRRSTFGAPRTSTLRFFRAR